MGKKLKFYCVNLDKLNGLLKSKNIIISKIFQSQVNKETFQYLLLLVKRNRINLLQSIKENYDVELEPYVPFDFNIFYEEKNDNNGLTNLDNICWN